MVAHQYDLLVEERKNRLLAELRAEGQRLTDALYELATLMKDQAVKPEPPEPEPPPHVS